jgi:hypothetical protein
MKARWEQHAQDILGWRRLLDMEAWHMGGEKDLKRDFNVLLFHDTNHCMIAQGK